MSATSWKLVPTHDSLLVHGYIHQHIQPQHPSLYIPSDIIHFLIIWYYDVTTWRLSGSELEQFFSLKNGEAIYGKPFKCNDITFHCSLCPSGWKTNQNGFVQYYLEVKDLPKNISFFTVYFEFYCYETKSSWKGIRTLTKKNDAVGWFHYTLPLSECREIITKNIHNQLTFGINIEILNINYLLSDDTTDECKNNEITKCINKNLNKNVIKNNNNKNNNNKNENDTKLVLNRLFETRPSQINRVIDYCWVLNNYPLQRFKNCLYPKNFHSPSFENNHWCFECQANFEHNVMIYCRLKLIKMPMYIHTMKIKCKLQTNMKCESDKTENGLSLKDDNGKWEIIELNYKHNYTKWKAYLTQESKHENSIRISIKIEIIQLIDYNQQIIDEGQWYKYGVIDNRKYKEINNKMDIQYCDEIENDGKNQFLTHLICKGKSMVIHKEWIKPNFLNIPMAIEIVKK